MVWGGSKHVFKPPTMVKKQNEKIKNVIQPSTILAGIVTHTFCDVVI